MPTLCRIRPVGESGECTVLSAVMWADLFRQHRTVTVCHLVDLIRRAGFNAVQCTCACHGAGGAVFHDYDVDYDLDVHDPGVYEN